MNWTIIMLVLGWTVAVFLGCAAVLRARKKPDGAIVICTDDPEKDTYTLELYIPFGELDNRKDVKFRITHI